MADSLQAEQPTAIVLVASIRNERICFSLSSRLMWMALSGSSPLKQSPSASSEKMAREVGYRTRSRSHCSCEGRCCSLTLEAQMALPTTWHPDAVRSWVSLRCSTQGSSSSGGPW